MRFTSIKEFLTYIKNCHEALAELYERLSTKVTDEKVKHLLEYMKNKEHISYSKIQHYVEKAPESLLETWLDSFLDQNFPQRCKALKLSSEITMVDVVRLAMELDNQLIEAMKKTAINCPIIEAKKALAYLREQEKETLQHIVMTSHEFEYM